MLKSRLFIFAIVLIIAIVGLVVISAAVTNPGGLELVGHGCSSTCSI